MKHERIILISIYVVLFSLLGIFIFQRYNASVTGKFYIVNDKTSNITFNDEICNQMKIITSTKYNLAVVVKNMSLFLNPNLISELKLPKDRAKFYNASKPPILYQFSPKRANIVIIGDSFTQGNDVGFYQSFPYYLSTMVDYNIVNLGVEAYNTKNEIKRLLEVGLQYNPKLIIWQFCNNDAEDTYKLGSFVYGTIEEVRKQGFMCSTFLVKENLLWQKLVQYYYENINNLNQKKLIEKNIVQPLYEFENIVINESIPVIGVMLPSTQKYWNYFPNYFKDNITILNMESEMEFPGWKPPFTVSKNRPHFSPKTNKELAGLLAKKIKEVLK